MTLFFLHQTHPNPLLCLLKSPNHPKPTTATITAAVATAKAIPARDTVIDFGKHKGKMLGTLPSTYLKWVSNNLRARDFHDWATLADQVLQDPVYKDRSEWELAEKVLNGNVLSSAKNDSDSPVQHLLALSERFGWDNEDKVGWSKVNFELLGTSKGGRIPRLVSHHNNNITSTKNKKNVDKELNLNIEKTRASQCSGIRCNKGREFGHLGKEEIVRERRRGERRERLKLKRGVEREKGKMGIRGNDRGRFANGVDDDEVSLERNQEGQQDQTVGIYNLFPGRQALLKRVLNRRRF